MDSERFDAWTRARARSTDRRSLLGWSLAAGVAAVFAQMSPAKAQFGNDGRCTWPVTLVSSVSAGNSVSGTLEIEIGDGGAIETGLLSLTGQTSAPVIGQVTGIAIDLLASLGDGTRVSLTGVADQPFPSCPQSIVGFLANPDTGQLGTWATETSGTEQAQPSGGAGQTTVPPAAQTQPQTQNQGAGNAPSAGGNGSCLELHSQCNASTECCSGWCTDNECRTCSDTICGDNCVVLSDNLAHCGMCFNACDVDTEMCIDGVCTGEGGDGGGCVDLGGGCGFSAQCCSGWCNAGMCDSCGMVVCNDMCVDTGSDNNNCGNCNNMCIGTTCQNGSCQ